MSLPGVHDVSMLRPQTAWWVIAANVALIATVVIAALS